ncbi:MAG: HDOD domain-containing protein [Candidatus Latescibacteria bacterium]|nr:HDOD domain-containing protein [Candidatus Latescibacterota bacterium]
MREKILELLGESGDLPPLPDVVFKLQKMIRDPRANARSIAGIIEMDPVLAGRIIKLSNSVFYSRSTTPIKTLPVAITKIGFNMLIKLVYSLKITKLFAKGSLLDNEAFWRHSLAVAVFTQSLSRRVKTSREEQDMAYLAGLMHDIGIIVFGHIIPGEYGEFLSKIYEEEKPLEVSEKEKFGIDHAVLGGKFIDKWWEVDPHISIAVRQHHFPFLGVAADRRCEQMVNVANGVCNNVGITNGIQCYHDVFMEGAWEELGLSLADVEGILSDVNTALDQARELMAVV